MEVNWEAIGAIGELGGSIVVLVSLLYIAIQVRDTKLGIERSARIERNNALSRTMLHTPEIASIVAKINEIDGSNVFVSEMVSTYDITTAESELYHRYLATAWRTLETDFVTLGDSVYVRTPVAHQLRIPSSRRFIETASRRFSPEFINMVDTIKREQDAKAT
jgi:hypothetical protein